MRRVYVVGVLVAVFALLMSAATSAVPPDGGWQRSSFDGESAQAFWFEGTETGVQFVDVWLNSGVSTFGDESFESSFVNVSIAEDSFPDSVTEYSGFAELAPDQFAITKNSAFVNVELELNGQSCTFTEDPEGFFDQDCEPLDPIFVAVEVSWDAFGRIYPAHTVGNTSSPFDRFHFMERSKAKQAIATGSISGGLVLALGEADQASVSKDSFQDRFRFEAP